MRFVQLQSLRQTEVCSSIKIISTVFNLFEEFTINPTYQVFDVDIELAWIDYDELVLEFLNQDELLLSTFPFFGGDQTFSVATVTSVDIGDELRIGMNIRGLASVAVSEPPQILTLVH
jgi:hypothetical protein